MTHYDIDYSTLEGQAKRDKAIEDIKDYMGEERFDKLTTEFRLYREEDLPFEQFACYMSIAGISGYPVTAWYDYIRSTKA